MNVQERVKICRLLDKMKKQKEYGKQLGLENRSSFHGCVIEQDKEKRR